MLTIYTRSGCVQCTATERMVRSLGLPNEVIDLEKHPELVTQLKSRGFLQAPVVHDGNGDWWAGYHPDKLKSLATRQPAARGAA